jgi:hypothetical protein
MEKMMKLNEVVRYLDDKVTRHQIFNWTRLLRKRRKAGPGPARKAGLKPAKGEYSDDDVEVFGRILQATLEGFSPEKAIEIATAPSALEQPYSRSALEAGSRIAVELIARQYAAAYSALVTGHGGLTVTAAFDGRKGAGFDSIARCICDLIGAERCAIYVPHYNEPDLVLIGESNREGSVGRVGFRIKKEMHDKSWTAHVAKTGKPLNLLGPKLESGQRFAGHLLSPRRSLLMMPLNNRKGRNVAIIKVENKRAITGTPFGAFDARDETLLAAFGSMLLPVIELYRYFTRGSELLEQLDTARSYQEISTSFLDAAIRITCADRGEITRWDRDHGLVFDVVRGKNVLQVGEPLKPDKPSLTYHAFGKKITRCEPDVKKAEQYFGCNIETRSEIAIPIIFNGRALGVLNIESDHVGGDGGLDNGDVPILEVLAKLIGIAAQFVSFRDAVGAGLADHEMGCIPDILRDATAGEVRACIVYKVSHRAGEIKEVLRVPKSKDDPICMRFDDISLAAKVFREQRAYFSRFPDRDPHVWADGLRRCGISGSMIGIPLLFETGVAPSVVGVVVIWNATEPYLWSEDAADVLIRKCTPRLHVSTRLGG